MCVAVSMIISIPICWEIHARNALTSAMTTCVVSLPINCQMLTSCMKQLPLISAISQIQSQYVVGLCGFNKVSASDFLYTETLLDRIQTSLNKYAHMSHFRQKHTSTSCNLTYMVSPIVQYLRYICYKMCFPSSR